MPQKDTTMYPLEKRIALILDYDLTLTEEWQQSHFLAKNLKAIKKAYDGKKVKNVRTGEDELIRIEEPKDYFKLSDTWAPPHNGIGYIHQILHDARKGILKDFTEKALRTAGAKVKISPGLPEFFKALRKEWKGECEISYFIVSVGLLPLIEGGVIAKSRQIDGIYASKLFDLGNYWASGSKKMDYDSIVEVVSPFNKTAHAIEIAKGARSDLNKIMKHKDYSFDYRNILVLGDGTSDISQFAYLRRKGSRIIGVYRYDSTEAYDKIRTNKLIQDRCNAIIPRDYSKESDLWTYVNQTITSMLKRKCQFDPELIDMHRKKKIRNREIEALVSKHLDRCPYCHSLSTISLYQPYESA